MSRRKIIAERMRKFWGAMHEQASTDLSDFQNKIEQRPQPQPTQQQESKLGTAEPAEC
jgi:hypothetical protein